MAIGVVGSALLFILVLSFASFGHTAPVVLMKHYHPSNDRMATIARLLIAMALIFGYSFVFDGLKTSLFSLLKLGDKDASKAARQKRQKVAICTLLLIAGISCFVTDQAIATVIGIVGSIFGSIVIYIFPALVNSSLLNMTDRDGNALVEPFFPGEAMFNQGLFSFGVVFAALGSRLFTHPEETLKI
jgi:Transmembrane amino acid transporter protein